MNRDEYDIIYRRYIEKQFYVEQLKRQIASLQQDLSYSEKELLELHGMKTEAESLLVADKKEPEKKPKSKRTRHPRTADASEKIVQLWLNGTNLETISKRLMIPYRSVESVIGNYIDTN